MQRSQTTIFIPTLNEAKGLEQLLPRILKQGCGQVLISDGNSIDGTQEIARKHGVDLFVQKRAGLRYAYTEAWPLICGQWVVTLSPDGNCIPEDIPRLLEEMGKGYDMVVASRYYGDARSEDDDIVTGFGNWFFTRTVNFLFKANYTDAMGIFRAYRTQLFYELGLDSDEGYALPEKIFFTRLGVEPLLSARAAAYHKKIGEIGSNEPKRIGGQRKLQTIRWGAAYYTQFFLEFAKMKLRSAHSLEKNPQKN
ncbi:MAG TPA: glycosyltransferase family 2 protein [Candidatus Binatia bacterium]|jgi:glycosyltransferase involved in cell wall biosynthesis